jgi:hypothetical protein
VPYQIIIGSNGSTDQTVALGLELQRDRAEIEFFHLPVRGVGLAFREFIRRAKCPVLVSLDMDLSADICFIEQVVADALSHEIIVGSKKLGTQRRSRFRKFGSDTFLWFARRLTGLPYDDYSIGAKAYQVAFLEEHAHLIGRGSAYVLELCYAARRQGRRIRCVPVGCEDRRASKFNLPSEALHKFHRLFVLWARTTVLSLLGSGRPARRHGDSAVIVGKPR